MHVCIIWMIIVDSKLAGDGSGFLVKELRRKLLSGIDYCYCLQLDIH